MTVKKLIEAIEWGDWKSTNYWLGQKSNPDIRFTLKKQPVWIFEYGKPTKTLAWLYQDREGVIHLGRTDTMSKVKPTVWAFSRAKLIQKRS